MEKNLEVPSLELTILSGGGNNKGLFLAEHRCLSSCQAMRAPSPAVPCDGLTTCFHERALLLRSGILLGPPETKKERLFQR